MLFPTLFQPESSWKPSKTQIPEGGRCYSQLFSSPNRRGNHPKRRYQRGDDAIPNSFPARIVVETIQNADTRGETMLFPTLFQPESSWKPSKTQIPEERRCYSQLFSSP